MAVFDLQNVLLGYNANEPVLEVPSLSIARGQIVFVNGPSGAGKSTLLEALGLMKKTLIGHPNATLDFHSSQGKTYTLSNAWDGEKATAIRSKYFSFIFQYTNLMPNFTLGENICFTGMLEGKSFAEVKPYAFGLMEQLNLEHQLFDQPATMASGGQRQRAAFVRALCKDFEVLFGDEPTGNLDKSNALALFDLLKKEVKSNNRTAIIVSHDENLSKRYADTILQIERKEGENTGIIKLC